MGGLRASVVINNHNYERFLPEAIESALAQTHADVEVVVVDDGSTDRSAEVIRGYGRQLRAVLKDNRGQASALAAGLDCSEGDVICFLDADDALLPSALEEACEVFERSQPVCVHWPLWEIEDGRRTGQIRPRDALPEGDLRDRLLTEGPDCCIHPPTSGSAWHRCFLARVFPIPGLESRLGIGSASADAYLAALAPLYGSVGRLADPRGEYRIHEKSDYTAVPFEERLRRDLATYDQRCTALAQHCRSLGLEARPERWRRYSWLDRLRRATQELDDAIPPGETFVLIDDGEWGMEAHGGRRALPLPERDGEYWGRPADGAVAVRHLERLRLKGASFAVVAWPAFWWLHHYPQLGSRLRSSFRCVHESEQILIFDLRQEVPAAA